MEFKEKIRLHQKNEYDFAEELLMIACDDDNYKTTMVCNEVTKDFFNTEGHYTMTFKRWRPIYAQGETLEEKLARNFKVWIARYVKKANSQRSKFSFEGSNDEINDYDVLDVIYSRFEEFGYHYYKDDFDKVPLKVWDEIEDKYGWDYTDDLKFEFVQFVEILPSINREKRKLKDEYIPLILESLNQILPKVDLNRSGVEIIGFIAVSTKREVNRKLTNILNKTHKIDGKTYLVKKSEMKFNEKNVDDFILIPNHKLTANQYHFYDLLKKEIQKEIKMKNDTVFTFCKKGHIIDFNKRFFAQKLNLNESAFKKRLSRLRNIRNI